LQHPDINLEQPSHVETVCLLSKLDKPVKTYLNIGVDIEDKDTKFSDSVPTAEEIKRYVLEKSGLSVSYLYIAQVKRKLGLPSEESHSSGIGKQLNCPPEKEKAIKEAFKHFGMI
jgi:23S rRNA (uracil1939-C5)-methyltransferase